MSERCSDRPEKVNGQPGWFGRACLEEDRGLRHVHRQGAEPWSAVSNVFLASNGKRHVCSEHRVLRGMFEAVIRHRVGRASGRPWPRPARGGQQ